MQCPSCGTWYADTQAFCTSCGDLLTDGDNPARIGHYRMAEKIGQGGVGTVFRAYDEENGNREVALKVLHHSLLDNPQSVARFRREAETQEKLKHPNIVELLDVYEQGDLLALVMELLEGSTLKEYLNEFSTLTPGQMRTVSEAILLGLQCAHDQHVTHRDLKPSNIFLCDNEAIKLMDFGLAKSKQDNNDITNTGMMVGSYHYMAPEQILGREPDVRTDLYAFGIILYQMATGKQPFVSTGGGEFEIMEKQVRHMPVTPSEVNPKVPYVVNDLIMELLAKDPDQRPQSVGEVLAGLQFFGSREPLQLSQSQKGAKRTQQVGQLMVRTNGHLDGVDDNEIPANTILWAFKQCSAEAPAVPPLDLTSPPPLNMETLKRMRGAISQIPPLPDIWHRIPQMMSDPDTTAIDIAREIEQDSALARKIIDVANCKAYAAPGSTPVTDMALALTRLGMDTVLDMVLQMAIPDFGDGHSTNPEVRRLWLHSRTVALFARIFSDYNSIVDRRSATLFGMLHDMGKLVILHLESGDKLAQLKTAIEEGKPALQAEWEILGYTHIDAGMMLALHWKLPRAVHRFIYYHHHPCWYSPDSWPADVQAVIMLLHAAEITLESMLTGSSESIGIWVADHRTHIPASLKMLQRPLDLPVTDVTLYTSLKQELEKLKLTFPDLLQVKPAAA